MAKKKEIPEEIIEDIIPTDYTDEISSAYLDYAVSVITARAIPDVRDGLKPVQRRILWAMKSLGLSSSGDYKKSARVVGETMGKYHPHGDSSIYEALVHLAQDWRYSHPPVDGHGNFGSVEGDGAAASRYTECRLAPIAEDVLLQDLDKGVVDFLPNFDNKEKEPAVLPARVPNILISGTDGIAVGMSSKMPSHNLGEVVDACVALIDNPRMKPAALFNYIQGPDFPTGGIIVNKSELPAIYEAGCGKIRIRGRVSVEKGERGKINIVVTEIPCMMIGGIDAFMDTVAELVRSKVMPDVTDIRNLSGKEGIRIVVELRKDADVQQNINLLYKKARLEDSFGYNAMLLSGGIPCQMSLLRILNEFLDFYRETQTRKYRHLLDKEKKAAEIREGLIKAVDCVDAIIETLRGSRTVDQVKKCFMKGVTEGIRFRTKSAQKVASQFSFTETQADAILEMRMQKLIGLEMDLLVAELAKCKKNIEIYSGYLGSRARLNARLRADLLEIKKKYAVKRRTDVIDGEAVVLKKVEIKEEKVWALVNRFGYVRLIDAAAYERNSASIPGDCRYVCEVMNTGKLYVFTAEGKCHQVKVSAVPMGRYNDKGVPLESVSAMTTAETPVSVVSDLNPREKLLFATAKGLVKKVQVSEFETTRRTTDATKLAEGDRLAAVVPLSGKGDVVLITRDAFCVSFEQGSISVLKKTSAGVTGIKLAEGDEVTFAAAATPGGEFVWDDRTYSLKTLAAGKRGTRGKRI